MKIRDGMTVRSWQKRLLNRLTIQQKLALNNFGIQKRYFFRGWPAHLIFTLKQCRRGVLVIYCQFSCFLWHCDISSFFFVPFLQGRTPASFMTPRRYIWVKMRKNDYSWGKQTSDANVTHVSVSPTQSTLRIFYVIDIKWIQINYIQFYPPSYLNLVIKRHRCSSLGLSLEIF